MAEARLLLFLAGFFFFAVVNVEQYEYYRDECGGHHDADEYLEVCS
jgi:hypothetical protein